jgi:hypothetical protein
MFLCKESSRDLAQARGGAFHLRSHEQNAFHIAFDVFDVKAKMLSQVAFDVFQVKTKMLFQIPLDVLI